MKKKEGVSEEGVGKEGEEDEEERRKKKEERRRRRRRTKKAKKKATKKAKKKAKMKMKQKGNDDAVEECTAESRRTSQGCAASPARLYRWARGMPRGRSAAPAGSRGGRLEAGLRRIG